MTDSTKLAPTTAPPPTTAEERARWQELLAWVDNADIIGRLLDDIERLEAVAEAAERLICEHKNRMGGNDCMYCNDCGLDFDWRKTTAREAAEAALCAALSEAGMLGGKL